VSIVRADRVSETEEELDTWVGSAAKKVLVMPGVYAAR
jgi:hypothetical protein